MDCCITCAVESISLIARVTAAVVTSNSIDAVSILITVIETTQLTLINIWTGREQSLYNSNTYNTWRCVVQSSYTLQHQ